MYVFSFTPITSRMSRRSRILPNVAYTWSRTIITEMPASVSWCSSSRSVYSGLLPTAIAPIRWQA